MSRLSVPQSSGLRLPRRAVSLLWRPSNDLAVQLAAEGLAGEAEESEAARPKALRAWPDGLAEQAAAVRAALVELGRPVTPAEVAAAFDAAPVARVGEWLAALAALGQARVGDDGRFVTA